MYPIENSINSSSIWIKHTLHSLYHSFETCYALGLARKRYCFCSHPASLQSLSFTKTFCFVTRKVTSSQMVKKKKKTTVNRRWVNLDNPGLSSVDGVASRCSVSLPGVRRMTDMVMREQTTTMTSRAMAMPFQFLWGGLTPPRSWGRTRRREEHGWGQEWWGSALLRSTRHAWYINDTQWDTSPEFGEVRNLKCAFEGYLCYNTAQRTFLINREVKDTLDVHYF